MKHEASARDGLAAGLGVPDVGLQEVDPPLHALEVPLKTGGKIVEDHDLRSPLDKGIDEVGADESGSTGDGNPNVLEVGDRHARHALTSWNAADGRTMFRASTTRRAFS